MQPKADTTRIWRVYFCCLCPRAFSMMYLTHIDHLQRTNIGVLHTTKILTVKYTGVPTTTPTVHPAHHLHQRFQGPISISCGQMTSDIPDRLFVLYSLVPVTENPTVNVQYVTVNPIFPTLQKKIPTVPSSFTFSSLFLFVRWIGDHSHFFGSA